MITYRPAAAPRQRTLVLRGRRLPTDRCLVMAIVNRTPDSFFDRGRTYELSAALDRVDRAVDEGAAIVDVGGVQAAPGAPVGVGEEVRRVVGLIERIRGRHSDVAISVDTCRADVAHLACTAGADLINDAWQAPDPRTAEVAAAHGAGLVCTHAGGQRPRTRPHRVEYDDVVTDVADVLDDLARRAVSAGVGRDSILVDPGHDFGKNTRHSLAVTASLDRLSSGRWPVLVSLSRKDFVGEVLDVPPEERLEGTLAATAISAWLGARVFRAHDVRATVRALRVVDAVQGRCEPAVARRGLA